MRLFTVSVAAAICLLLAACGGGDAKDAAGAAPKQEDGPDAAYVVPPGLTNVAVSPGGGVALIGRAEPGARVRLTPLQGQPRFTDADPTGAWRIALPPGDQASLHSLAMLMSGRTVLAEGYVIVTPDGRAAQLRAGAGAIVAGPDSSRPRILAIDYDRDGAAVVSGAARPGAGLQVRIDRNAAGDLKAGPAGRFAIPVSSVLRSGGHRIDVAGEGGEDAVDVSASPAPNLGANPFLASRSDSGWRIDWKTPGGGVQTTLLLARSGGGI